jgi:hypothetical protein
MEFFRNFVISREFRDKNKTDLLKQFFRPRMPGSEDIQA